MKPKELGPYLLLRKLSEDALCETYRAGRHTGQDVEHLVLLYFFARDPANALWIAETAQAGRRALAGLESPCLAPAIDSGEEAGVAYLAYDYIPGRSLLSVLKRTRGLEQSVQIEHALLIADRVAQGLLAAWEHESRMLHGFVVPHLVMLSNEGDVRLLGLEVASRLRKLLADPEVRQEMGAYLAPEVVPEGQPATTDDVYSLGALLYEMVTGKALPASGPEDLESLIDQATTGSGSALPEGVVELLRGSLGPYSSRVGLNAWHSQLGTLLASGEYDASAFRLALFMHTLFGEEIEAEETLEEPDTGAAHDIERAMADLAPLTDTDADGEVVPEEILFAPDLDTVSEAEEPPAADNRRMGLAAGIAAVVLLSFGAWWFFGPQPGDDLQASLSPAPEVPRVTLRRTGTPNSPAAEEAVEAAEPAEQSIEDTAGESDPQGLSPEEIDRRVQELLSQRSADMESSLRQEYEAQVAELQQQLELARQRQVEEAASEQVEKAQSTEDEPIAEAAPEDQVQLASLDAAPEALPSDGPSESATVPSTASDLASEDLGSEPLRESSDVTGELESAAGDEGRSEPQEPAIEEALSLPGTSTEARREPMAEPSTEPPARSAAEAVEEPPAQPPVQAAADPPARDTVQPGDLVASGPGVTIPRITRAAQPVYPMLARRLKKEAVVTVRVLVDENGKILEAERLGAEAGYGFDEAAVQAARKSVWQAADKNGVPVKMWTTVRIAFEP